MIYKHTSVWHLHMYTIHGHYYNFFFSFAFLYLFSLNITHHNIFVLLCILKKEDKFISGVFWLNWLFFIVEDWSPFTISSE